MKIHRGDKDEVLKELCSRLHDRRRLNEQDISLLIDKLAAAPEVDSRLALLDRFIGEARAAEKSAILSQALPSNRREAFLGVFKEPVLRSLETERTPDYVAYYVHRGDGTLAGPIEKVSAGQQGTAVLNLLLAAGDEPLLVDTPEEGLDSEGVYTELVPLFRREKEKRQIVIITHNANLPVNADAEGIFALEATGFVADQVLHQIVGECGLSLSDDERLHVADLVRWNDWESRIRGYLVDGMGCAETRVLRLLNRVGEQRMAEGRVKRVLLEAGGAPSLAMGALDSPAVKRAVQDITEGSVLAFQRRLEKYGF